MEIKINILGVDKGMEIGMDQYKNVYSRPEKHNAWEVVHEYRHIPRTRYSSSRDMKIIGGNDLFTFAVDNNDKF